MKKNNFEYNQAAALLASMVRPVGTEPAPLEQSSGRILAQTLKALEDVPAFNRSAYDGYAFRAEDTADASPEHPAILQILEEVPAGFVPSVCVTKGTAVKIMTGAAIPNGADAVVMYEKTAFTREDVTIREPGCPGENIICVGEDVKCGQILAVPGMRIDPGLAGALAAQGIDRPLLYRRPAVGIISTGSELTDIGPNPGAPCPPGTIRNTNRYIFAALLQKDGCDPIYLGTAGDDAAEIAALIRQGLLSCDLVLLTGGVSAGDYDRTPEAMEQAGCEILIRGVDMKPGMACCYGVLEGKLVCALSGNPVSALTNYYAVLRTAVRKMTGLVPSEQEWITVTLAEGFGKKSGHTRFLKGRKNIEQGRVMMYPAHGQGNVMIGSSIGCDVMTVVPAGSGPLAAGTELRGFEI